MVENYLCFLIIPKFVILYQSGWFTGSFKSYIRNRILGEIFFLIYFVFIGNFFRISLGVCFYYLMQYLQLGKFLQFVSQVLPPHFRGHLFTSQEQEDKEEGGGGGKDRLQTEVYIWDNGPKKKEGVALKPGEAHRPQLTFQLPMKKKEGNRQA